MERLAQVQSWEHGSGYEPNTSELWAEVIPSIMQSDESPCAQVEYSAETLEAMYRDYLQYYGDRD